MKLLVILLGLLTFVCANPFVDFAKDPKERQAQVDDNKVTVVELEHPIEPEPPFKQATVDIEEAPVKIEEAPVKTGETPVKTEEALVKIEEAPVKIEEAPVKVEEDPVKVEEAPVEIEEAPVEIEEAPVEIEDIPVEIVKVPVEIDEALVEIEEAPVEIQEAPVEIQEAPVDTEEAPVEVEEAPVEIEGTPEETPEEIEEVPVEIEEAPVEIEEAPVEIEGAPVEIEGAPVEIEGAPVGIEETPVDIEEAAVDIEEATVEIKETPVEIEEAPVEIEEAPVEIEETPMEIEEAPVEIEGAPVEIEKAPVKIEETPVEVEAAPVEIEELPVKIEEESLTIEAAPVEIDENENNSNVPIDSPKFHKGLHYIQTHEEMHEMGLNTMNVNSDLLEDAFLAVPELIQKWGYPSERHTVQTTDGYLLEMHRIPYSPRNGLGERKQPVFLMHGLLDSSSTWVIMRPSNGLAYILADLGYDVWMGNARGNRYSRRHITFDPDGRRNDRSRFWDFSWHEIGITDLPNMIDYVLSQTGFEKLHYIGHSQGTTSFFVMGSERPAYNDKILSMQALAPVAFMSNLRSPFVRAASLALNTLDTATSVLGIYEFLPSSELLALGGQAACRDEAFTQALCYNILFLIAGFNSAQTNTTMIPVMLGHTPSGASANQLIHYGQSVRSGRFRRYDSGTLSNLWNYGSISAPNYNLRNIRAPVALHYSANDWLAEPADVEELHQGLPNVIGKFLVPDPLFNHLDFVWAIDVRTLLYDRVIQIMRLVEEGILPFQ